jgi:hypothetical protein
MNKNSQLWMLPVAGSFLFTAAVSAAPATPPPLERAYLDSTNRITASVRFGLNISGKFKNPGGSLNPRAAAANGRRTPNGDHYNYDDGYVLTDSSKNAGGQSWYWGYDHASQVNAGANTIDFSRTTAPGLPAQNSGDDSPYVGFEITYDYELGVKEDWHHLRYGIEAAFNGMPINFNSGGTYHTSVNKQTDTYGYTPGTTPPGYNDPSQLPYQGGYGGPGFLLNVPRLGSATTSTPGTIVAQQHFDADLFGFRLGPYIESPLTEKLSLHLTGGLAVGILNASANWKETVTLDGGLGSTTSSGSGTDTSVLWGYYFGLDAVYQINERWGVDVGVQFQDLGTYSHDFGGRTAELDLSNSMFIQAGISYSF